jgi:hypothetical protein
VPDIPAGFSLVQPAAPAQEPDLLTLLPTSTYKPPTGPHSRSASAPPEKFQGHQRRISNAHSRQGSRDDGKNSITVVSPGLNGGVQFSRNIDETIRESQVIIIEQSETPQATPPPMLPELQHLAGPMPPPPPPAPMALPAASPSPNAGADVVVIEEQPQQTSPPATTPPADTTPTLAAEPAATPSQGHRRGRNSISESVGSRIRGAFGGNRHRERSASRQRPVISPPVQTSHAPYESVPARSQAASPMVQNTHAPYESISHQRRPSQPNIPTSRTPMPYESIARVASPPQPSHVGLQTLPSGAYQGYKTPKEIARAMREREEQAMMGAGIDRSATAPPRSTSRVRANMPPHWTQAGAEPPPI